MRAYTAESEEALRARRMLKDWSGEGLLSEAQYERLEQETVSGLRTTNIYLRAVFFLFTVSGAVATVAFFFWVFLLRQSLEHTGICYLVFAAICYAAAEFVVSHENLYRHGIEEALAVCSVGFFCWGLEKTLFSSRSYPPWTPHAFAFLVPAAGVVLSLWIWRRFGLWYAFPAAMLFVRILPNSWTASHTGQPVTVAIFYAMGLAAIAARGSRHRFDYLRNAYSLAEAFLWLGIYLQINLKLSLLDVWMWWIGPAPAGVPFYGWYYWTTWVLIWCLPPFLLARGIRKKDRFVLAAGGIAAVLTLVSNKPYLGWQRHTWDPMLLGILLAGIALWLRRWLARGPGGVRHGFTAERLSERDKRWVNAGSGILGLVSPHAPGPAPQTSAPEVQFGGGASGGAGASGDF